MRAGNYREHGCADGVATRAQVGVPFSCVRLDCGSRHGVRARLDRRIAIQNGAPGTRALDGHITVGGVKSRAGALPGGSIYVPVRVAWAGCADRDGGEVQEHLARERVVGWVQ